MFFKHNRNLPPMKYYKGQEVYFNYFGDKLQGIIEILDYGGSVENKYHSYDIYVDTVKTLYKHIPESDISEL
ncbi:hypothetical protein HED34_11590 [Vagococcus fluvialis]|uniref:hypothetical protein n=1 Tax=Vagococcus fluvialis TaxID=2738 RepID=UPI001432D989|nr:hypothetical protein [Vagococcus fluvialis]NKC60602.1 hypothetical protein [Vagococcus fluvialis]NKD51414.1 hypothetical protein [Vagococcus fluvialis]